MSAFPPPPPLPPRTGPSAVLKVLVIGVIAVCLFVPLMMVWTLVAERSSRRDEVVTEVTASVGKAQTVGGIVVGIPYDVTQPAATGGTTTSTRMAYVHPDQLTIDASLSPEIRRRTHYDVPVYRTRVRLTGTIVPPDFDRLGAEARTVHWDRATTTVEISDLRGTVSVSPLRFGDRTVTLEPMADTGAVFAPGVRAPTPLPGPAAAPIPFEITLTLAGSEGLRFLPTGKATDVKLTSPWPSPGFNGAFLPTTQTITDSGFTAAWQVSHLARTFPHAWLACNTDRAGLLSNRLKSTFGVTLVQGVDHYQKTERAVKYGLLFVVLTFTVFLLWELLRGLQLHPVQYLLIGAALVIFYLLLLSLAEHIAFSSAYGIAAGATIALVAAYSASVLAAGVRGALGIAAWLGALYGVLFVLLVLEDLALLVGSLFLFAVLAAVMFLTRRIDWGGLGGRAPEPV